VIESGVCVLIIVKTAPLFMGVRIEKQEASEGGKS
jgi:hypothetical protein